VVLADGSYDALIRSIDPARRTVVLDLIQVFHDGAAVKAAVEDGRSPADAQYLTIWIRNQNPRLRTLPLASDLRVQLWGSCDEAQATRPVLTQLADDARHHLYYLSVTVRDGQVRRFEEHQIQPAC